MFVWNYDNHIKNKKKKSTHEVYFPTNPISKNETKKKEVFLTIIIDIIKRSNCS